MTIVAWLAIGVIAGLAARVLVPGEIKGGLLTELVVGIVGALLGGWLGGVLLGTTPFTELDPHSIIVATCGALVLLFLIHSVARRRGSTI